MPGFKNYSDCVQIRAVSIKKKKISSTGNKEQKWRNNTPKHYIVLHVFTFYSIAKLCFSLTSNSEYTEALINSKQ